MARDCNMGEKVRKMEEQEDKEKTEQGFVEDL